MTEICVFSPLLAALIARVGCGYAKKIQWGVIGLIGLSFWMSIALLYHLGNMTEPVNIFEYTFAVIGPYRFEFGFWLDGVSLLMAVMVLGISLLVCIYSVGYMQKDRHLGHYFSYVAFFSFAMLWLVLSDNLLQLFFGWEGVGIASYLLIGFWSEKKKTAHASTKAFLLNRVGDLGLLMSMSFILYALEGLHYDQILQGGRFLLFSWWGLTLLDWVGIGFLIAAMAKSAQVPLHLWLPDSMVGPTPISALIHAATMVTAGIFLILRFSHWFVLSKLLLNLCISIGLVTSILMGMVALTEYNIKRIIAYSTISQLGIMLAACGLSGYVFSLFHLVMHGVFKALMFLTAGGIIWVSGHQEDCRDIGGLRKHPILHGAMIIGLLSLAAIPPFGGFFSKKTLLMLNMGLLSRLGFSMASILTVLYATRLYVLLFVHDRKAVLAPMPKSMEGVLWVLMALSLWSGFAMLSYLKVLSNLFPQSEIVSQIITSLEYPFWFIVHSLKSVMFVMTFGILASIPYWDRVSISIHPWIMGGFGMEYALSQIVKYYTRWTEGLAKGVEFVLDQLSVLGTTGWAWILGMGARALNTGRLAHYLGMMLLGMIIILVSTL